MKYASIFRRLIAFFIDCTALIFLYMAIGLILGISIFAGPISTLPMVGFWYYGGMIGFSWLYFVLFEISEMQATPGKKLLGLKVVDLSGEKIGFWRGTVRYFSKTLSRLFLMFGFLMIAFTKKKQALHDKIASTLIIEAK